VIKEGMEEMMAVVKENSKAPPAASRKKRLWFAKRAAN
jgi:hypothetical protein